MLSRSRKKIIILSMFSLLYTLVPVFDYAIQKGHIAEEGQEEALSQKKSFLSGITKKNIKNGGIAGLIVACGIIGIDALFNYKNRLERLRCSMIDDIQSNSPFCLESILSCLKQGISLDFFGVNLLFYVIYHCYSNENFPSIMQTLIKYGADPYAVDEEGNTIFHCAAMKSVATYRTVRFLTQEKKIKDKIVLHYIANKNVLQIKNKKGETPKDLLNFSLCKAINTLYDYSTKEIKDFLDVGANPNYEFGGKTLLHMLAEMISYSSDSDKKKILKIMQLLIDKGANCYLQDFNGDTLFHYAIRECQKQPGTIYQGLCTLERNKGTLQEKKIIMSFLIMRKIKGNVFYKIPKPIIFSLLNDYLCIPTHNKSLEIVNPAVLEKKNHCDQSPKEMVQLALQPKKNQALITAVQGNGSFKKIESLLKEGASPLIKNCFNQTLLHMTVLWCHNNKDFTAIMQLFIDNGVDCYAQDDTGNTIFHYAAGLKPTVFKDLDYLKKPIPLAYTLQTYGKNNFKIFSDLRNPIMNSYIKNYMPKKSGIFHKKIFLAIPNNKGLTVKNILTLDNRCF